MTSKSTSHSLASITSFIMIILESSFILGPSFFSSINFLQYILFFILRRVQRIIANSISSTDGGFEIKNRRWQNLCHEAYYQLHDFRVIQSGLFLDSQNSTAITSRRRSLITWQSFIIIKWQLNENSGDSISFAQINYKTRIFSCTITA